MTRRPQGRRRATGHADWCGAPSRWQPRNADADVAEAHRHHRKLPAPDDPTMSQLGQTEKNSVRAHVFRFDLELGHCLTQLACLKRVSNCPEETHAPQQLPALFDHLVGAQQERFRYREASALAALRLMTSSNLVGVSTGSSHGRAPREFCRSKTEDGQ